MAQKEIKVQLEEINLRDYLGIVVKRKNIIFLFTLLFATFALLFSLFQKPIYEAKITLLIRNADVGGGLSQFAGIAGVMGVNLSYGKSSIGDLINILKSKAVAEKVLVDLKLRDRVEGWNRSGITEQKMTDYVKGMMKDPKVSGNYVELSVRNSDAGLAAEIANGYADALSFYWNELNYTEAQKKRDYIESQLPRVERELKDAESRLKKFTILAPKIESNSNLLGIVKGSQSQGIEVVRLSREMDIQNSVYTMLRKEYENVKLEESKEIPPFSIIDKAVKPENKAGPRVKLNTAIGLFLGAFSGIFFAFFMEYWEKTA